MSRFPVAFRLPAFASWPSFARWGTGPPLTVGLPADKDRTSTGLPRSATHEIRPGWVPSIPPGSVVPARPERSLPARRLPLYNGMSLYPGQTTHHPGFLITRHQSRVQQMFTRPAFPSPVAPGWNGALGLYPELHTPSLPTAHVEVGTGTRHYLSYVAINWPSCLS